MSIIRSESIAHCVRINENFFTNPIQNSRRFTLSLSVPASIRNKVHKNHHVWWPRVYMRAALKSSNVTADDFKICWKMVKPSIPDEKLVDHFRKMLGAHSRLSSIKGFIQDIMQRYKAMSAPVCLSGMPIFCLSVYPSRG